MFNTNDPVVKLVLGVLGIGVGILLITVAPYALVALVALLGVGYYLLKQNRK